MDYIVTEEGSVLTFKTRSVLMFLFGGASLVLAPLFYFLMSLFGDEAYAGYGTWIAAILLVSAVLFLILGIYITFSRSIVFDGAAGTVSRGGRRIPFSRVGDIAIKDLTFGDMTIHILQARLDGKEVALVSSKDRQVLEELRNSVKFHLGQAESPVADGLQGALPDNILLRKFLPPFLLLLGAIWSIVGYLTMPNVALAHFHADHGTLFWPLGIWISTLGVLEACGVPVMKLLSEGPSWRRLLVGALWLSSYFILCDVRVQP